MNEAFESIKKGLNEAVQFAEGNEGNSRVIHLSRNVDVKGVRKKMGMTQKNFDYSFCICRGTLRHWERGDRKPGREK